MKPTIDELKTLVRLQLGLSEIGDRDHLIEALGAESADMVNIIAAVEDKYQVSIDEDEIAKIHTVADLYKLIQNRA